MNFVIFLFTTAIYTTIAYIFGAPLVWQTVAIIAVCALPVRYKGNLYTLLGNVETTKGDIYALSSLYLSSDQGNVICVFGTPTIAIFAGKNISTTFGAPFAVITLGDFSNMVGAPLVVFAKEDYLSILGAPFYAKAKNIFILFGCPFIVTAEKVAQLNMGCCFSLKGGERSSSIFGIIGTQEGECVGIFCGIVGYQLAKKRARSEFLSVVLRKKAGDNIQYFRSNSMLEAKMVQV